MEFSEVTVNGNGEAWVRWKGDVEILLKYVSPELDRTMRGKVMKQQWRGHQRMEAELDEIALRDYYLTHVVKGIRGLTMDGEPFNPDPEQLRQMWDSNHEFGIFVIEASRKMDHFVQEKKL